MSAIAGHDYSNVTPVDVENIIINMQPNSLKSITTICYVFGLYARYIGNDDLYNMVHDVNRNSVWVKAKPNAPKKFISHSDFENVYRDEGVEEHVFSIKKDGVSCKMLVEGFHITESAC